MERDASEEARQSQIRSVLHKHKKNTRITAIFHSSAMITTLSRAFRNRSLESSSFVTQERLKGLATRGMIFVSAFALLNGLGLKSFRFPHQFFTMIINQGCNSLSFLSVDLPDLPDWKALENGRFNTPTGRAEYDRAVKTVLKEFEGCLRKAGSQGVLGGAICNAFDAAYLHKVSGSIAMIGCKDGSQEQKKFAKAVIDESYPMIVDNVRSVYEGSSFDEKTRNIVAQLENKLSWLHAMPRPDSPLGVMPILTPKFLADISDMLFKYEKGINYVSCPLLTTIRCILRISFELT